MSFSPASKGYCLSTISPFTKSSSFLCKKGNAAEQCLEKKHFLRESPQDPSKLGWILNEFEQYIPHWTDLPPATSLAEHFVKCGCKTKCSKSKRCSCKTKEMLCTSLCTCDYELCNATILSHRTV